MYSYKSVLSNESWGDPTSRSYQPMAYQNGAYSKSIMQKSVPMGQQRYSKGPTAAGYLGGSKYPAYAKTWSATPDRSGRASGQALDTNACPFTREQLDQYRSRISSPGDRDSEQQPEFSQAQNLVYREILNKLPSTKHDNGQNILTDQEKQIVRDELDKLKRGAVALHLDGDADTSLSMIHMIFHFFLQSGEYAFFIKRVKNIA